MRYPAKFKERDEGELSIEFRDFPGFQHAGAAQDEQGAVALAQRGLISAIKANLERNQRIPMPSLPDEDEFLIELPIELSARLLLLNEILSSGQEFGQSKGSGSFELNNILTLADLDSPVEIGLICDQLKGLGKRLEVRARPIDY